MGPHPLSCGTIEGCNRRKESAHGGAHFGVGHILSLEYLAEDINIPLRLASGRKSIVHSIPVCVCYSRVRGRMFLGVSYQL